VLKLLQIMADNNSPRVAAVAAVAVEQRRRKHLLVPFRDSRTDSRI
jgi:hypothetical protein